MKKIITILTMSLCSIMAFSQIAPEVIVSKPVKVKKSTNQIAYGTEDDQGNTTILMNNFEGGVRHMVKFDKDMNLLLNVPLKNKRDENVITSIRVKDKKLQALVDVDKKITICDFKEDKFDIPKYKKNKYGSELYSFNTYKSNNSNFFIKANRVGKYKKGAKENRTFIIANSDWDLISEKNVNTPFSLEEFESERTSYIDPDILDDGTIVMNTTGLKLKASKKGKTRKNRQKEKDIPYEKRFYFIPANEMEASEMIYLGSDNRSVKQTLYKVRNDTLYALSITHQFPEINPDNKNRFLQLTKIPFSTKKISSKIEFPLKSSYGYVDDISLFHIDKSGNAKFVLEEYVTSSAYFDNSAYYGNVDIMLGEITSEKHTFYFLERAPFFATWERIKGAGTRYDSGFFTFVDKNEDIIVLLNSGDFKNKDNKNFLASFLDKDSQKRKKHIGRELNNIKSQAYIFKLGDNGLQYEAIEKNYDNNLAFERAYLNEKGEVIVATGEWDSKQFVKMKF